LTSVRTAFTEELGDLKKTALRMGEFVAGMLRDALEALYTQDVALARDVKARDDTADGLDEAIENQATRLLALQQPMARDLRAITASLKIVTDLERIGDYAVAIARTAITLADEPFFKPLEDTRRIGDMGQRIVSDAMAAFEAESVDLARATRTADKAIDDLWHHLETELIDWMKREPRTVDQAARLILVARYVERIGDHAKNICERVAYMQTGFRKPWRQAAYRAQPQAPEGGAGGEPQGSEGA